MIKCAVLGSGSKGNAIYFQVDDRQFLVDCGFGKKQTIKRLAMIGRRLEDIERVFVTHDHKDHCAPWVMKEKRKEPCTAMGGFLFLNKGIKVESFPLSHDSDGGSVGYAITDRDGNKAVVIMDTGCIPEETMPYLFDCSMILIETNYDICMLINSPYPTVLQERIASNTGHLRAECAAEVVGMVAWPGLKYVVGLHLSSTCINPVLARFELENARYTKEFEVVISEQSKPTKMMTVI